MENAPKKIESKHPKDYKKLEGTVITEVKE